MQGISLTFSACLLGIPSVKMLVQLCVIMSDYCDLLSPSLYLYLAEIINNCCFSYYNMPTILVLIA